ncbi:hypothetical protein ACGFJC_38690 [Nonomuraea fuscirosea]|uniref:hypothetical protein n=1 Tax=Nonomuraea fuscirosea TaxID=1291556 RepID=UPI00371243DA
MIAGLRSPRRSQVTDQALEFGGERWIVLRRLLQRQPHPLPRPRALPPLLGLLRELRQGGLVPQPLGHDLVQPVHPGVDGQIHFLIGPPEHPPELLHQVAHHVPGQQFQLHAHLLLAIALLSPAVSTRPIATRPPQQKQGRIVVLVIVFIVVASIAVPTRTPRVG